MSVLLLVTPTPLYRVEKDEIHACTVQKYRYKQILRTLSTNILNVNFSLTGGWSWGKIYFRETEKVETEAIEWKGGEEINTM